MKHNINSQIIIINHLVCRADISYTISTVQNLYNINYDPKTIININKQNLDQRGLLQL